MAGVQAKLPDDPVFKKYVIYHDFRAGQVSPITGHATGQDCVAARKDHGSRLGGCRVVIATYSARPNQIGVQRRITGAMAIDTGRQLISVIPDIAQIAKARSFVGVGFYSTGITPTP